MSRLHRLTLPQHQSAPLHGVLARLITVHAELGESTERALVRR